MLSIDTPTNLTVEIGLPVTLIDAQKTQYDRLPTRRATSMHLVVPTDGAARRAWIEAFVRRFYTVALERKPDTQGFLDWVDSLDKGNNDGAGIGQGFILSDEFRGKNLSNVDYLVTLYRTFFDREPDEEGFAYWLGQMRNGVKRKVVLAGFINSKEFADVCADYGIKQGFMRLSDEDMAISDDVYQERLKECTDFISPRSTRTAAGRTRNLWRICIWACSTGRPIPWERHTGCAVWEWERAARVSFTDSAVPKSLATC